MADTIISTDGLTNLNNMIKDDQYENTLRAFTNKDYLSDKLTQLDSTAEARSNDALNKNSASHQRIDDEIRAADNANEARATRNTDQIVNRAEFLDQGAARRFDATTLAAALNASTLTNALERNTDRINDQTIKSEAIIHNELDWLKSEARTAVAAQNVQNYAILDKVGAESAATRALINQQYADSLRDKLAATQAALLEVRGDVRHWEHEGRRYERDSFNSAINGIGNQINNLHQAAAQGTVNFGYMSGNAGRNTSTNNIV